MGFRTVFQMVTICPQMETFLRGIVAAIAVGELR